MRSLTIQKEDAVCVLIDIQERLMPGMNNGAQMEETMVKLVRGCRLLDIPILVTQQYSKGLGLTTAAVIEALTASMNDQVPEAEFSPIEKTSFSAMKEPEFTKALEGINRKTVILAGVEAHVCVLQTALHLIEAGYTVYGVLDCMSSRTSENKELGQIRMAQSGVIVTGCETVLFELLADAKASVFKQISAIVK